MALYKDTVQDILMMYVWEANKEDELTTRKQIVDFARPKLFDFDYPLYDETLKEEFEEDFIRHFYMREHGQDSIALFKQRLEDYLYLNHDKWLRLYNNMTKDLNIFVNYDVKTIRGIIEQEDENKLMNRDDVENRTNERNVNETEDKSFNEKNTTAQDGTATSNTNDFNRNVFSNLPDERLQLTLEDGVGALDYASTISEDKNIVSNNENSESNTVQDRNGNNDTTLNRDENATDNRTLDRSETTTTGRNKQQDLDEHKVGKVGSDSYMTMYNEYVRVYQSLNRQIFRDMSKLFMGLLA